MIATLPFLTKIIGHPKPHQNSEYEIITHPHLAQLRKKYQNAWKDPRIPARQRSLVDRELQRFSSIAPMQALISVLKEIPTRGKSLLEIGCASGYYSEVLKKAGLHVRYRGCDYSPSLIALAKEKYPLIQFDTQNATDLDYDSDNFDIVVSGCCLLAIFDYQTAIAEATRVSRQYVIFHRTPVIHEMPTTFTKKNAYGVETIEIFFNEENLVNDFRKDNLVIAGINTHARFIIPGLSEPVFMKTYLCQKSP